MDRLMMRPHGTKGILITFCGLDGCGKSTIIRLISEWLSECGENVFLTKQPTEFVRRSDIFRTYMDTPEHDKYDYRSLSLLAASDRIQHSSKVILPALEEGKIVISDRYFYSCAANLAARGYTEDQWIYEISGAVVKPDIAVFLDVPVNIAISRVRSREEEKDRYIDLNLQYKLRNEYIKLAKRNDGVIFPSNREAGETFKDIKEYIKERIEEKRR